MSGIILLKKTAIETVLTNRIQRCVYQSISNEEYDILIKCIFKSEFLLYLAFFLKVSDTVGQERMVQFLFSVLDFLTSSLDPDLTFYVRSRMSRFCLCFENHSLVRFSGIPKFNFDI